MHLLGLDLGKKRDPAALAVFDRFRRNQAERRYLCRAMRRWHLGTKYTAVVQDVKRTLEHPRLQHDAAGNPQKPVLVVDATGVGEPVVELMEILNLPATVIAVTITSGNAARPDESIPWHWHVPKHLLVDAFEAVLREDRYEWPRNLRDPVTREDMKAVLLGEVTQYRGKKNLKRPKSFGAAAGHHDDVLMAVSYVAWWGER